MTVERTKFSPPEVARMWGISADKVLAWINAGELRAMNVAINLKGRPRYRIDIRDLEVFENRRSVSTEHRANGRRRRKQKNVIEYF